jgi:type I site-specific restriction-modification system R (restriction) subunit
VEDAVQQYKRDRNPNELLFRFGRCMAHFAMDDQEVRFCTHLNGENSWFLPFNKGYNDGAGNPPNPSGIKTDYLWRRVLTREGLTDIIQHSAGSGKSYSITWLSRQLMEVKQGGKPIFDSVIVVTDRRILDSQIRDNIKQFTEVSSTVGHAKDSGVKAVQTLSRLNRAHPKKYDTFVLDFKNDADTIRMAFEDYYRTTILSEETDPNKLHDLKSDLDNYQVYSSSQVDRLVGLYLTGSDRDRLDPILDMCVDTYRNTLDEDEQIDFKGKAKGFVRTYGFLASILPYSNLHWEKLSIFLNFLIPKLPAPTSEDLSKGILETIDMDSYRVEVRSTMAIELMDEDKEIGPVPSSSGGHALDPELDRL